MSTMVQPWLTMVNHATMVNVSPRQSAFWQINHANSAYFRLFLGYFRGYISHPAPLLDLGPTYPGSAPVWNLRQFLSIWFLMYRHSKSSFLQVVLNWSKWMLVVDIPTQILLTILLFIDYSSRCKLKVYLITHTKRETITKKLMFFIKLVKAMKVKRVSKILECLLLKFIYFNSKFHATCENVDFECQYIRTHTKDKPSKINKTTFAILPSYQEKYSNWMAILSTLESIVLLMKSSNALQNGSF